MIYYSYAGREGSEMSKNRVGDGKNKKDSAIKFATLFSIILGVLIMITGMIYYKYYVTGLKISDTEEFSEYGYHYAIISEEEDATFWDAIYQGACEKGKEQNVFVEEMGRNLSKDYSLEDLFQIAIAAKVDGIILEPNGGGETVALIKEADRAGIPVVTVLQDEPESERKSYIGVNSYTQGQIYGKEVMDIVKAGKKNIVLLLSQNSTDASQNMIYSSILEATNTAQVSVKSIIINEESSFGSEEEIRKLIMDENSPTDLLVCLTAADTLSAYQAVVDYNKVGQVDIIGYYDSDIILSAIEKDIIHSTMTIDANQMGAYCVEALTEYRETGNVSDYYSVDIDIINKSNYLNYLDE
jgi:ribose transport system substrate-binding protein